jgi:hypothetical protein
MRVLLKHILRPKVRSDASFAIIVAREEGVFHCLGDERSGRFSACNNSQLDGQTRPSASKASWRSRFRPLP